MSCVGTWAATFAGSRTVLSARQQRRDLQQKRCGRVPLVRSSQGATSSGPQAAWERVEAGAQSFTNKLRGWARQQRLEQHINSGLEAAGRAAQEAAQRAQSTARRVQDEYDLPSRAKGAAERVNSAAEELDYKFQFRRRAGNFMKDARRRLPYVWRQLRDFSATPMGAVTFFFLFLMSVFTGAFWVILRIAFSLLWLGILLSPVIINYANARMVAEQQKRYRAYMAEQQRRQQNPFYGTVLEDLFAGRQRRAGSKKRGFDSQDVIDVSFDSVSD